MRRDGMKRFCERCGTHVNDLSAMTEPEARAFLRSVEGQKVCVRYRVGSNGELRFAAPPPMVGAGVIVAAAGLLAACAGWEAPETMTLPDTEVCRDQAGWVIECEDAEPTIPDEVAPIDEEPVENGVEGEVAGGVEGGIEGAVVGAMVSSTTVSEDTTSCPIPPPPPGSAEPPPLIPRSPSVVQGGIMLSVETGRRDNSNSMEAYVQRVRRERRADRRERRRARRQRR
jgi:hypothetical protein